MEPPVMNYDWIYYSDIGTVRIDLDLVIAVAYPTRLEQHPTFTLWVTSLTNYSSEDI